MRYGRKNNTTNNTKESEYLIRYCGKKLEGI